MDSNLKVIDEGLKALLFDRYKTIMGLVEFTEDITFFPKEVAQRIIAEKRANTTLEFINVWRTATRRALDRERMPLARSGLSVAYSDVDQTGITTVKGVPADLDYSVWFWSRDKDKLNYVIEDALFWKFTDPNLNLTYDTYEMEYDVMFGDMVDESPVEVMFDKGLYFVLRLDFTVQGWALQSDVLKTIKKIFLKIYEDVDPGGPLERSILLFETIIE